MAFTLLLLLLGSQRAFLGADLGGITDPDTHPRRQRTPALVEYFEQMSAPKPLVLREGEAFKAHQATLRQRLLECIGLWPLPDRLPLDVHRTEALDHPWCTVERVYYPLWPGVYASGLLYRPKAMPERPAPAMLCPHGHWSQGSAHPIVQTRCLVFAKQGYVTFSPNQNHYEDLNWGISHQTLGVWGNMRALDFLSSLPEVDGDRIGVCGESGGGLQTQMLAALDPRVKAATVVGMTCDFREILFPHAAHCDCNHFPGVMRFTDAPEISALACPVPMQYLCMNDWTRHFPQANYPALARLYAANGHPEGVQAFYEPTEHTYDRSKRERTYGWMNRWLRRGPTIDPIPEPDRVQTFPPETLQRLALPAPEDDQFTGISAVYRARHAFQRPTFTSRTQWKAWRTRQVKVLAELLGQSTRLPPTTLAAPPSLAEAGDWVVERTAWPGESALQVPTLMLRSKRAADARPVVVICHARGKEAALEEPGEMSARALAAQGALVVLPDLRFTGEWSLEALAPVLEPSLVRHAMASMLPAAGDPQRRAAQVIHAWERNAVVWGRPQVGMAVSDLRAVLDGLASVHGADLRRVRALGRGSGRVAMAVLFAAALDRRIASIDLDLDGACFGNGRLSPLPFVLWHGDVLEWSALLANRQLTLRHVPPEAGDTAWLTRTFALLGNPRGLTIEGK